MAFRQFIAGFLVLSLCTIVSAEIQEDSIMCQTSIGQYFYDLSPLEAMGDIISEDIGTGETYYFSVCKNTHHCAGNPACTVDRHDHLEVLGTLQSSEWSSEYTAANLGISLVYSQGASCGSRRRTTTIIFECDRNYDFNLIDLATHSCDVIVSARSRFACPRSQGELDEQSESSSSAPSNVWWITLLSVSAAAFLCATIVAITVGGVCIVKRVRKNSWSSVSQEDPKWNPSDDIEYGLGSVEISNPSATVLTPGYAAEGLNSFSAPQYIPTSI